MKMYNNIQNILLMGAIKSITHNYTWNEYLFWYIEKNDIPNIQKVLAVKPELLTARLTINFNTTALHRAAGNGNLEVVRLLVEKYKAEIDFKTEGGESPLIGAVKKNQLRIVNYLLSMNANADFVSDSGLRAVDYAVLAGLYQIALNLFEKMKNKELKTPQEYAQLKNQYKYRYVNYEIFLDSLDKRIDPQHVKDFLTKPKVVLEDPVIDPRESWKQWFWRNLEFKDPPLCERKDLPQELQPQSRKFGKLRHFFTRLTISPLSQKPNFHPESQTEAPSQNKMIGMKKIDDDEISKMQVQSIS